MGIKDTLSNFGNNAQASWQKPWKERSITENSLLFAPKSIYGAGKGFYNTFFGTPFPSFYKKIKQEIDRDSKVQLTDVKSSLYFEGRECHVPATSILQQATISRGKDGENKFVFNGRDYRLTPIKNPQNEFITNNNGDKLYKIHDDHKIFSKDKQETQYPAVWIHNDSSLSLEGAGKRICSRVTNKVKAITIVPRNERTGQRILPLLFITWPLGFAAILMKWTGALCKSIIDIPGNLLCKAQNKLLDGLDTKYAAQQDNSIDYATPVNRTTMNLKSGLGKICGVSGSILILIGNVINETLRSTSALTSSTSALCGPNHAAIVKANILTMGKSWFNSMDDSITQVKNSAIKSPKNMQETPTQTPKTQEVQSTIEYTVKADPSVKQQAGTIGKVLHSVGLKLSEDKGTSYTAKINQSAQKHDNMAARAA